MKAIMINESEGGYQELTGFKRVKGNRTLGGCLEWEQKWDQILGEHKWSEFGKADNKGNGGSTGSTTFYDFNGNQLGIIENDGTGTNSVTFVNMSFDEFNSIRQSMGYNMLYEFGEVDNALLADGLRHLGVSYDIDEYINWNEENDDDLYTGNDYSSRDGLGLLKLEHTSYLHKGKDGYVHPDKEVTVAKNPDGPDDILNKPTIHNHVNEGRKYYDPAGYPRIYLPYDQGGMRSDIGASSARPGTGVFDITITGTTIIFYNTSGIKVVYKK